MSFSGITTSMLVRNKFSIDNFLPKICRITRSLVLFLAFESCWAELAKKWYTLDISKWISFFSKTAYKRSSIGASVDSCWRFFHVAIDHLVPCFWFSEGENAKKSSQFGNLTIEVFLDNYRMESFRQDFNRRLFTSGRITMRKKIISVSCHAFLPRKKRQNVHISLFPGVFDFFWHNTSWNSFIEVSISRENIEYNGFFFLFHNVFFQQYYCLDSFSFLRPILFICQLMSHSFSSVPDW